jgi:predicted secreted Zn-dependent protease
MKLMFISLLSFFLMSFSGTATKPMPKEFISWDPNNPVTWSDFKGKAQLNAKEAAMTASAIEFNYETNGVNMVKWKVQSKFYPELSWSRKDKQTAYILKHERLHFDITEVYARILRKRFIEEIRSVKDIPKIKTISKAVMAQWNKEQQTYDAETNHSINTEKQQEWNQAVADRLEELKEYTQLSVTVKK